MGFEHLKRLTECGHFEHVHSGTYHESCQFTVFQEVVLRRVGDKENLKCEFVDRLMMRKLGKPGGGSPINTWLLGMDKHPTLPSPRHVPADRRLQHL